MKRIVVVGGIDFVASMVVEKLRGRGYEAVAALDANTLTGERLAKAVRGAAVVIVVCKSQSRDDAALLRFFETSTRNILDYSLRAGVGHLVAFSVVGGDRLPDSGYLRAKNREEELIANSSIPFSMVRTTQLFESIAGIADDATHYSTVLLPPVLVQPVAASDVASTVTTIALAGPVVGAIEVAGPEQFCFNELVQRHLIGRGVQRVVVGDPYAHYLGTELDHQSLLPGDSAVLGTTCYEEWFTGSAGKARGDVSMDGSQSRVGVGTRESNGGDPGRAVRR
ncbi:MAG TPA: NAD(P)H-binding protein [Acidimicrobiales bacterium]